MEWKEIGEGYRISDAGIIQGKQGACLLSRMDRYGYELVTLWLNGKHVTKKVHRLVAEAFIPNPEGLPTVNHINGIKDDNRAVNLEWLSVGDNHKHAFKTGLHTIGENRTAGRPVKLKDADILQIRKLILEGLGNTEIGRRFGVSCGCIYSIRMNKSWSHIQL